MYSADTQSSKPSSRDQLKDFCLRQLGFPVVDVNVDDQQVEDCIDLALQYFQQFSFDGVEKWYTKHQVTGDDITNQYIPIGENIIGVTRIFPLGSTNASVNMFDLRYQLRLHELYDFTSTSYVNYVLTMQHIRTLDLLFSGEAPIRFSQHHNRLYIDWQWGIDVSAGEYIIIESYMIIDPDTYTDVYNDRMFKKLATAYIKRVYATNIRKFGGMQLLGGAFLDGREMYNEAMQEIQATEEEVRNTYEQPASFMIG